MTRKLTDALVKGLPCPATGNKVHYDAALTGFGCRVTAKGIRSFVLNYRTKSGLERRYTIGQFPNWNTDNARKEARNLRAQIDLGGDPIAALSELREAPTVADLCTRYENEHLPKKRASSRGDDKSMIDRDILVSDLKNKKVRDIAFSDIDALHRKISNGTKNRKAAPYRANRVVALLSKMFGLAVRWKIRSDNPVRGIERNQENKRHRYLTTAELSKLIVALKDHKDRQAADILRLLLLSGARRGEVQAMRWADINFDEGVWTKPGATTKRRTEHRVPLSGPARLLLTELRMKAVGAGQKSKNEVSDFVFPSGKSHRVEIKKQWAEICSEASIIGARIHDLRHTYASVLVSAGLSLPIIGQLLGHTQVATTARYTHLFDEPQRQATERAGAILTGQPSADIVPIRGEAK